MGAVKECLRENARWDDDLLVLDEPIEDDLLHFALDQASFEDWGSDR